MIEMMHGWFITIGDYFIRIIYHVPFVYVLVEYISLCFNELFYIYIYIYKSAVFA